MIGVRWSVQGDRAHGSLVGVVADVAPSVWQSASSTANETPGTNGLCEAAFTSKRAPHASLRYARPGQAPTPACDGPHPRLPTVQPHAATQLRPALSAL
jgi:hypothetical protein